MVSQTPLESSPPQDLTHASLKPRGKVHPSPKNWRDQILYQLLPDRFSDGNEATRPLFDPNRPQQYQVKDKAEWMEAGTRFNGGTIKGIHSKLDYLKNLGVTTLWINPPWKQRYDLQTYHGYGIQNFLDIDPRFGTRQELRDLIDAAHEREMYVILDVIFNHSGNNWYYQGENGSPKDTMPYRFEPTHPFAGWRSSTGECIPQPKTLEDGVWPKEFQNLDWYSRCGEIGQWGLESWEDPLNAYVEYRKGDFYDLKDINLENPDTLEGVIHAYRYWIAVTDCDGFRLDAVKHISPEASGAFARGIHEYAEYIGKENFFLTGEITDASIVPGYIDLFGRNLDSILEIIIFPNKVTALAKGLVNPNDFFSLYDGHTRSGLFRQVGQFAVSVLDDHDMSSRAKKERFAANSHVPNLYQQVAHVVGIQLTVPGIPAIYYGTEQAFDGNEDYHDYGVESRRFAEDRYVREAMFGGDFGAFATQGCHFFNPNHPTYLRIAAIASIRNRQDLIGKTLRQGYLYYRETSYLNYPFGYPAQGELIGWSMIYYNLEVLIVFNPHGLESRGAMVTVDSSLHEEQSMMTYLYKGHWTDEQLKNPPNNETVTIEHYNDGRAALSVELPPSGMAILVDTEALNLLLNAFK
ncbi:MAG: alpha-amylase family glycosyl hydrolase [Microcystaceae cyanobacterium]